MSPCIPLRFVSPAPISRCFRLLLIFTVGLAAAFTTGCGGSSSSSPPLAGNTSVTVLASSTANDQLSQYKLDLDSLTLTSQSGKTVTVFSTLLSREFIHLNGTAEPLLTVSLPQDVYTSATATFGDAEFTCVGLDSSTGELEEDIWAYDAQKPPASATVNLPAPITITGAGMGISLDMLVSQSASFANCLVHGSTYSITPAFNVTPVTFSAQPSNSANGMAKDLHGLIGTVSASETSFSVTSADGLYPADTLTWQVTANGSTVYQGITGASELAAGLPVDMDVAIQADGSLLATRVAVYGTNTADLTISSGPLLMAGITYAGAAAPALVDFTVESQGQLLTPIAEDFSFGNAVFQTSSQLTNVQNLPFTASFNAANMVRGQNVFISTHALSVLTGPVFTPAATITLLPQTINGTVSAVSTSGNFTTYAVSLAPYDIFPDFAVQPGQSNLLTNSNTVVVYADSNTQLLNSDPIAVGSLLRFNGLVFNDNGTLRMDCDQVNDGVAE